MTLENMYEIAKYIQEERIELNSENLKKIKQLDRFNPNHFILLRADNRILDLYLRQGSNFDLGDLLVTAMQKGLTYDQVLYYVQIVKEQLHEDKLVVMKACILAIEFSDDFILNMILKEKNSELISIILDPKNKEVIKDKNLVFLLSKLDSSKSMKLMIEAYQIANLKNNMAALLMFSKLSTEAKEVMLEALKVPEIASNLFWIHIISGLSYNLAIMKLAIKICIDPNFEASRDWLLLSLGEVNKNKSETLAQLLKNPLIQNDFVLANTLICAINNSYDANLENALLKASEKDAFDVQRLQLLVDASSRCIEIDIYNILKNPELLETLPGRTTEIPRFIYYQLQRYYEQAHNWSNEIENVQQLLEEGNIEEFVKAYEQAPTGLRLERINIPTKKDQIEE